MVHDNINVYNLISILYLDLNVALPGWLLINEWSFCMFLNCYSLVKSTCCRCAVQLPICSLSFYQFNSALQRGAPVLNITLHTLAVNQVKYKFMGTKKNTARKKRIN
jgi:hypothetical protein